MLQKNVRLSVKADRQDYYSVDTNVILYDNQIESIRFPVKQNYFEILEKYGPAIASLVSRLKKIRGIEHVYISTCEISVHMAGLNYISDDIRNIVADFIYLRATLEEQDEHDLLAQVTIPEDNSGITLDLNAELTKKALTVLKGQENKKLVGLNVRLKKFIKALLMTPGVTSVRVDYYKVVIEYAPLFDKLVIAQAVTEKYIEFTKK